MNRKQAPVAAVQKAAARVARQLSGLGAYLRKMAETLPEAGPSDADQEPGFEAGIRSRIECVIVDSIDAGIRDLEAIASQEAPDPRVEDQRRR